MDRHQPLAMTRIERPPGDGRGNAVGIEAGTQAPGAIGQIHSTSVVGRLNPRWMPRAGEFAGRVTITC